MRVTLLRPMLFAERRFDAGVTINVSPEIGAPLVSAGVVRDADTASGGVNASTSSKKGKP